MVDFVLKGAGEVAAGLNTNVGTVFEKSFDLALFGAGDEAVNFWNREATFVIFDGFAVGFDDFGVDEGSEVVFLLVVEVVADDNDALVNTKLRGGHSGGKLVWVIFFPVEGSFDHIFDDFMNFSINNADFLRLFAKAGIRGGDNFHTYIIAFWGGLLKRKRDGE